MWSVRHISVGILLLAGVSSATAVCAQRPLTPGSTVRLTLNDGRVPLTGFLSSVSGGTLTIALPDGEVTNVARADITAAEVMVQRRNTLRGTLIGGGVGLVGGLLIVATADDNCDRDSTGICDAFTGIAETAALIWAPAAGAALGALVGTLVTSERWVPAFVPSGTDGSVRLLWSLPLPRALAWEPSNRGLLLTR